ncbi:MAG: hypothetical protein ACFHXK_07270 [bacterium]
MNMRNSRLALIVLLTVFMSTVSHAGPPAQTRHFGKALMSLDLTDDQRQALTGLRAQFLQRAQDAGSTWRDVRTMLEAGDVDAAADVAAQAARKHIYFLYERKTVLASILTPEQMAVLEDTVESNAQPPMTRGRPW